MENKINELPVVIIPIQISSKEFLIYLDHLHHSLKSVQIQSSPCRKVLLDYNSHKSFIGHIQKIARKYGFVYVRATHKDALWARGRALNAGVRKSTGDPVFFVDSDCVLPPKYIEQHCKVINEKTITFSPFYDSTEAIVKSWNYNALFKQKNAITKLRPKSYSHVGIPRSWLEKHKGFDETYRGWGAEDDDIMLRFKRSKMNIQRIPTFPIHLWHTTWQELMKDAGKNDIQRATLKMNRRKYWEKRGRGPRKKK